jgi:hypothetical protein
MKNIFMCIFFTSLCFAGATCGEPNIGFVPPMGPPHNFDQMGQGNHDQRANDFRGDRKGDQLPPLKGNNENFGSANDRAFPAKSFLNEKTEKALSDLIQKEAKSNAPDPEIADIAKRIQEGNALHSILDQQNNQGRLSFREMGPLPMIGGFLIPIFAILGACFVLCLYLKLKSKRDILLIEKNIFKPEDIQGFRIDAALSVAGTVLIFWGIALTLFSIIVFGISTRSLGSGIIPFIVGIGCYIAFIIYRVLFPKSGNRK